MDEPADPARRRLIVNADDFGDSPAINEAVIRAHSEGVLTTASLMVNGGAWEAAVELARRAPRLGVGLHLTLVAGRATLGSSEIPRLVNARGEFSSDPVRTGMRYFLQRDLRADLRREIEAQFGRFSATGLVLDHVNGHLNLHLHPTVFGLLCAGADGWRITRMRLTRDRFWLDARLAKGNWGYRISHALIFNLLCIPARRRLSRLGIASTKAVFGLLQTARVDEEYLLRLIPRLPRGVSEVYSHPSLDRSPHEFAALVSPRVAESIRRNGIELIRYCDFQGVSPHY